MEIYLGNELGNLSVQDCMAIKELMDGKSYYQFKVSWSNYACNCQLIVKTDYPRAEKEAVRTMFLHVLASETSQTLFAKKMLEVYTFSKFQNPKAVVEFRQQGPDSSFIFEDAVRVADILSLKPNKSVQGWPFLYLFQYDSLDYVREKLSEEGYKLISQKVI